MRQRVADWKPSTRLVPLPFLQILNLHPHSVHDCDCKDRSGAREQFGFYVHINLPASLLVFFVFGPWKTMRYLNLKSFCLFMFLPSTLKPLARFFLLSAKRTFWNYNLRCCIFYVLFYFGTPHGNSLALRVGVNISSIYRRLKPKGDENFKNSRAKIDFLVWRVAVNLKLTSPLAFTALLPQKSRLLLLFV